MILERVSRMGFAEIAGRGRQEVSKWIERVGSAVISPRFEDYRPAAADRTVSGDAGGEASRFFEGATSPSTPGLIAAMTPGTHERIVAEAEQILSGSFDLLGHRNLRWGDPIDWHRDPLSGRAGARVHWSRLDPLDPLGGGDCKLVWELNRHQWMVRLGQAYRLTGDERYAAAFAAHLRHWMECNPPGVGINWASSLEAGLRLISWCWARHLFDGSATLDEGLRSTMTAGIAAHAAHVERHLSRYFSPNTHLTGEALSLCYAGALLHGHRRARRWREVGSLVLAEQIERQVLPDGVYFEQSTCYQRYTLEIYLHHVILAGRNDQAVPPVVRERIGRMIDFMLAIRAADGSLPQIGDSDGGRLMPLEPGARQDCRALFSTAAALLRRADCARAAGGIAGETIWLLGARGPAAFESPRGRSLPAESASRLFPAGGYAVMSAGAGRAEHRMIFDVGPLGCPITSGHGHSDLLGIHCSAFGKPYLVDPGTCCYTTDRRWRDHFRGSASHCTVTIDGQSQARPAGPFSWNERPAARLRRWLSDHGVDLADAEHDAYGRLDDPVVHRRRVIFVKPRYWVIVDDLHGTREHTVEIRFQIAPLRTVRAAGGPRFVVQGPSGRGLVIAGFGTVPLEARVEEGGLNPIAGWVSPDFGIRVPAPGLVYRTRARLPIRTATLILPVEEAGAPPPSVAPLMGAGPSLGGLAIGGGRELVLIEDDDLRVERSR